jgi:hypothetical protein
MKKFLNILLGLLFAITAVMVGWAVVSGGNEVAISWNLVWGYALLVGAVLSVLISAIKGTITNPAGLKKTMLAIVLVVVVVGAALFIALGHEGIVIPNSAGGVFDDPFELVISEVGILVTYVVAAASIIVTLYTEVRNLFK